MFGYFVFVSVSYLGCSGLDVDTSTSVLLDNVWMEGDVTLLTPPPNH